MIRKVIASALFYAAIAGGVTSTAAQAAEVSRVTVTQTGEGFWWMAQYVAEATGIYKKVGLEVDTVYVSSGSKQIAAVIGGSALATTVNFESGILANANGGDIVAVGGTFGRFPMSLVLSNKAMKANGITPDMPIDERVKRLKGLRIAISSAGSGTDQFLRTVLEARGLNADQQVSIQPIGNGNSQLAALESGIVDGMIWTSPIVEEAETRGIGKIVINALSGETPEYTITPYIAVLTSRRALETRREDLQKLVTAYALALKFIHDHPEETRAIVRKKFPDIDDAAFNKGFATNSAAVPQRPSIDSKQFETTVESMKKRGGTASIAFKDAVDNSVADYANAWVEKNK